MRVWCLKGSKLAVCVDICLFFPHIRCIPSLSDYFCLDGCIFRDLHYALSKNLACNCPLTGNNRIACRCRVLCAKMCNYWQNRWGPFGTSLLAMAVLPAKCSHISSLPCRDSRPPTPSTCYTWSISCISLSHLRQTGDLAASAKLYPTSWRSPSSWQ